MLDFKTSTEEVFQILIRMVKESDKTQDDEKELFEQLEFDENLKEAFLKTDVMHQLTFEPMIGMMLRVISLRLALPTSDEVMIASIVSTFCSCIVEDDEHQNKLDEIQANNQKMLDEFKRSQNAENN